MNDIDFDRTARLWLEDGPTVMSDRAVQSALDEIHVTRQRPAWWPARRVLNVHATMRLAIGAAAIMVAVIVGINFLPHGSSIGGAPIATPTPVATQSPTPTPSPVALTGTETPLAPGTYVTPDPFPLRVTFSVPAGWSGKVGGQYYAFLKSTSGTSEVAFSRFDKVYADPCHSDQGLRVPVGPSAGDLATALTRPKSLVATTPTDMTVAGYQGKQLALTAPTDLSQCTVMDQGDRPFRVWELPLGGTMDLTAGQQTRVWILDVSGVRLVISATPQVGATADMQAQIQGILDSVRIAPSSPPTPAPS